ncbi:MAG: hypothetical protein PHS04_06510 [Tissierellia bacterium]|nr:hypothetical protein [Tissierellia bacterium]
MKRTICYIDDKIPVSQFPKYFDESSLIDRSVLNFLLKCEETDWDDDINVKGVIELLMKKGKDVNINAFTAPNFFIDYRDNVSYINPDIILYDWDYNYPVGSNHTQEYLLDILKTTYAVIIIYTGVDNYDEIVLTLENEPFILYKDRIEITKKSEVDSTNKVIDISNKKFESNFSFKYGKKLLNDSNRTLNEVLSEISSLSIEQFIASFGQSKYNKYRIDSDELASIIFEKYKQKLIDGVDSIEIPIKKTENINIEIVKKSWAYRLYYTNNNKYVKQGDIVKDSDGNFFLIFSSDCHMDQFWNKNYGYVSLIPMYKIEKEGKCKDLFGDLKRTKEFSISSLVNPRSIDNATILPALPFEQTFNNYLLLPKGIRTVEVELPSIVGKDEKEIKRSYPLEYSFWNGYKRVVSISETFKYPLILFIQNQITGYGCPDFSDLLKKYLEDDFKQLTKS